MASPPSNDNNAPNISSGRCADLQTDIPATDALEQKVNPRKSFSLTGSRGQDLFSQLKRDEEWFPRIDSRALQEGMSLLQDGGNNKAPRKQHKGTIAGSRRFDRGASLPSEVCKFKRHIGMVRSRSLLHLNTLIEPIHQKDANSRGNEAPKRRKLLAAAASSLSSGVLKVHPYQRNEVDFVGCIGKEKTKGRNPPSSSRKLEVLNTATISPFSLPPRDLFETEQECQRLILRALFDCQYPTCP